VFFDDTCAMPASALVTVREYGSSGLLGLAWCRRKPPHSSLLGKRLCDRGVDEIGLGIQNAFAAGQRTDKNGRVSATDTAASGSTITVTRAARLSRSRSRSFFTPSCSSPPWNVPQWGSRKGFSSAVVRSAMPSTAAMKAHDSSSKRRTLPPPRTSCLPGGPGVSASLAILLVTRSLARSRASSDSVSAFGVPNSVCSSCSKSQTRERTRSSNAVRSVCCVAERAAALSIRIPAADGNASPTGTPRSSRARGRSTASASANVGSRTSRKHHRPLVLGGAAGSLPAVRGETRVGGG